MTGQVPYVAHSSELGFWYCDLIGILEVGTSRAEMGLVRSCVLEARNKFLGRIKKQCENLHRLLLLWFEGPRTRYTVIRFLAPEL